MSNKILNWCAKFFQRLVIRLEDYSRLSSLKDSQKSIQKIREQYIQLGLRTYTGHLNTHLFVMNNKINELEKHYKEKYGCK